MESLVSSLRAVEIRAWRPAGMRRLVVAGAITVAAACGGGRTVPRTAPVQPDASAPVADSSVQGLYESGRYAEVINRVSTAAPAADPEALWLAAHSHLRLGQREQAERGLRQLSTASSDPAWQATSQLALAMIDGSPAAIDTARQAAHALPTTWFVQYELGLADAIRGDFNAAVQAFERAIEARPRFAYAYYQAGLAYDRIGRADLLAARFETFLRLAPEAPERAAVEGILRTIRGR
jgi:tetratricopeptide (TPR) repeat protein